MIVAATVYVGWELFQAQPQLPFSVRWKDAHHALIVPVPGVTSASLRTGRSPRIEVARCAAFAARRAQGAGAQMTCRPAGVAGKSLN